MRRSAALALAAACALSGFAGEGFRWRIDEINEIMRPDVAESANLGGIAWVSNGTYIAVTDWNSVIWELTLPYNPKTGRVLSCELKRLSSPVMAVDVEALALDPLNGSVWLADERAATIRQYSYVSGKALAGNVDIPASLKNFRQDSGFESLSISADGLSMWTCTEEALKSDGSRATRKVGTDVRLARFRRKSAKEIWKMSGQWVYHTDPIAGGPWYSSIMEFVDGITLKDYIDKVGALGWKEAVHYVRQILNALSHAHEKGIVHRDIKPQNIMLLRDGTVKVTDFGIAKTPTSESLTMTDKAIGTVNYISPEQASGGKVDEKSDLYSVGVMLYEMLTGKLPFVAESPVAVAMMQVSEEPRSPRELNSQIPIGLEQIVIKSMSKDPSARFSSAASMEKALEYFLNNPSVVFSGVAENFILFSIFCGFLPL